MQSTVNLPKVPAPVAGDRFIGGPVRYVSADPVHHEAAVTPTDAGETLWTCPMHPQIIRTEPGFCPICGAALEPMTEPGRRPKARAGYAAFGRKAIAGRRTCKPRSRDQLRGDPNPGYDEGLDFAIFSGSEAHVSSVRYQAYLTFNPCLNSSRFGILLSIEKRDEFNFLLDLPHDGPTLTPFW